jgi:predicted nucleotidyltransferase component of viral defense system
MTKKNAAASVRQRLLNLSRKTGEDFHLLLTRYAVERLLFRLSHSEHNESFVLKGAMLFALWTGEMHRPTRDLDLLGFGDPGEEQLRNVFRALCNVPGADDGVAFREDSVSVAPIREDQEYGGQRVKLEMTLEQARIDLQVDIGFGDAITPGAEMVDFPTLLGTETPRLRAYPKETVVAEKLEAMVKLGLANTRMKDFYDLLVMSQTFSFQAATLSEAIAATFARRRTEIPEGVPVALTDVFAEDDAKNKQWGAFLARSGLEARVGTLDSVVEALAMFLVSPLGWARDDGAPAMSWAPDLFWV